MKVLNWAGLVINGSVAFILPLILCSFFYYCHTHHDVEVQDVEMSHSRLPKHHHPPENAQEPRVENSRPNKPIEKSIPDFLLPYRWWIIHAIILLFVTMIVSTIILDILTGNGP